jgi:hypothetical protein
MGMARDWNSIHILINSALSCNINAAFGLDEVPEAAETEPLCGDWSEEVRWGREGDIRMCDDVASRFTGICREGEDTGWKEDEPSPLSAPGASGGASSSLSGTGESSLSGVRGRDGGGFSSAGSCWELSEVSGDVTCERGGAVAGVGAVEGADAPCRSGSRRGELGGGVSDDCRGMGDVFCKALSGEKGGAIEADGTEGELSLLRTRGSESLEDVEIEFHEKWSLDVGVETGCEWCK